MGSVPVLETGRLHMRELQVSDLDTLWQTVGRADVMENYVDLIDHSSGWTREETDAFITKCGKAWKEEGYGRWGMVAKQSRALIGYCGLNTLDYLPEVGTEVEVSFRIHPDYWGRGLAPEAARAAIDWGFNNLGVDSIVGCAVTENTASLKALAKLGMVHEMSVPYHSEVSGADAVFEVFRLSSAARNRI